MVSEKELREIDRRHLWHPYSDIQRIHTEDFPIIERAESCYIYDKSGKRYLDGIASWWCVNFGHSHPLLLQAIQEQAAQLQNVILAGMSHESAILLAQKLAGISPNGLNYSYFASDGASSVEAALRIALQYWENLGNTQKKKFICLQDAYHGDTLGAVSVGYVEQFHHQLQGAIPEQFRAMSPHCAACPFQEHPDSCAVECFSSMQELVERHHQECAAVIIEPLCQGAGGIRMYPELYLQKLRALCDAYNLLLICDEIAVGFGRMGRMFASQQAEIIPDLLCVGKGLTGGYLPMSAVLVKDTIYKTFISHTFYHGHTYCGNPIIAALALKSLQIYEDEKIIERIQPLIPLMKEQITALCPPQSYAYSKGMVAALELSEADGAGRRASAIADIAWHNGLFIRPLGPVVYLWPPLVIRAEELYFAFDILQMALDQTRP